jgi:hypothetical protein
MRATPSPSSPDCPIIFLAAVQVLLLHPDAPGPAR